MGPGWYQDEHNPNLLRWWDGQRWTGDTFFHQTQTTTSQTPGGDPETSFDNSNAANKPKSVFRGEKWDTINAAIDREPTSAPKGPPQPFPQDVIENILSDHNSSNFDGEGESHTVLNMRFDDNFDGNFDDSFSGTLGGFPPSISQFGNQQPKPHVPKPTIQPADIDAKESRLKSFLIMLGGITLFLGAILMLQSGDNFLVAVAGNGFLGLVILVMAIKVFQPARLVANSRGITETATPWKKTFYPWDEIEYIFCYQQTVRSRYGTNKYDHIFMTLKQHQESIVESLLQSTYGDILDDAAGRPDVTLNGQYSNKQELAEKLETMRLYYS